jgi:hypothetical protein
MVEVTFHDSFDDMMGEIARARDSADARVQPWQEKHRAGDILVSDPGYGFAIFHEVLDNEKLVKDNLWKYGDDYEDEGIYTLDIYTEPHMKYFRFCNNFSVACPYGELGDFHISETIGKISREDFEYLKGNGFQIDRDINVYR